MASLVPLHSDRMVVAVGVALASRPRSRPPTRDIVGRLGFLTAAKRLQARRRNEEFGVAILAIDDLARFQIDHGYEFGEQVVTALHDQLTQLHPPPDLVARLGDDQFGVVYGKSSQFLSIDTIELAQLGSVQTNDGATVRFVVSGGHSQNSSVSRSVECLLREAEIAYQQSLRQKTGAAIGFTGEMRNAMQKRASAIAIADRALSEGRIFPYFQPKVHLATQKLVGFEALLRWTGPDGAVQNAGSIAEAFETVHVGRRLNEVILSETLRIAENWRSKGLLIPVAINFSQLDFQQPDFASVLIDRINAAGLPAEMVEVEITERVLLDDDNDTVGQALERLSKHGLKLTLDDFGTGYASISHLQRYPIAAIKIDRAFITGMEHRAESVSIVKGLIGLASDLGLEVVAEGIENYEQFELLKGLGCPIGQGYLFSPAVDPDEAEIVAKEAPTWQTHSSFGAT